MTSESGEGVRVDVEWGLSGARALTDGPDRAGVVVVVDVLSFSTSVTVACERGARVWPHPGGEAAHELARSIEALLAGTRSHRGGPSLSPTSLLALPAGARLVLPSPNGSSIAHALMSSPAVVVAGCMRNAAAAAEFVAAQAKQLAGMGSDGGRPRIAVVPAGERWGDGSLRVAYEDHVGAGAVVSRLLSLLPDVELSAEARVAVAAFERREPFASVPSGRELVERGFVGDVALAEQVDASDVVPVLAAGSFRAD